MPLYYKGITNESHNGTNAKYRICLYPKRVKRAGTRKVLYFSILLVCTGSCTSGSQPPKSDVLLIGLDNIVRQPSFEIGRRVVRRRHEEIQDEAISDPNSEYYGVGYRYK